MDIRSDNHYLSRDTERGERRNFVAWNMELEDRLIDFVTFLLQSNNQYERDLLKNLM